MIANAVRRTLTVVAALVTVYGVLRWWTDAPAEANRIYKDRPLVTDMYTADPSAHVFHNTIYIYPSHDIDDDDGPYKDEGGSFKMRDYHVFSMPDGPSGRVHDHGSILDIEEIPWAARQLWAPDVAHRNGSYYLYFPAKQHDGLFTIGVAISNSPKGPFTPNNQPIEGVYSIDPAVLQDDDGEYYIYFGGIGGGQLQQWSVENEFIGGNAFPQKIQPQIPPRVARLSYDMQHLAEEARPLLVLNEQGTPIRNIDQGKRFFEASWVHKYNGNYYFSYSTGTTHRIVYATSTSPYGPFQYRGILLEPVLGWTTHQSVLEYDGQWYLFYHDCQLSNGINYLRNMKMTPIVHRPDGSIQTIDPYK